MDQSPLNRTLAEGVHRRMASESFHHTSRGVLWRFLGYGSGAGLAGLGVGAGLYLAFLGYSYINDNTVAAERLAGAIRDALQSATIKTEGTVGMKDDAVVGMRPDAEVGLKDGETVSIDNPVVRLDPKAQVKVSGLPQNPPSHESTRSENGSPVVTSFTVFKSVKFSGGQVDTGWKYHSSRDQKPYEQYCYWISHERSQMQMKVSLGQNGRYVEDPNDQDIIDRQAAFKQCQWL